VLRSALSAVLFAIACLAPGQSFGRFGYTDDVDVPGFTIARDGFVPRFGASEKFYFPEPASAWKVLDASDTGEDLDMGFGSLSANLYAPGFMLKFPKGFSLRLLSTSAPYLSWKDASVGEHVPTPDVRWIAVSFKQAQPPIVLGFLDSEVALQVDGHVGAWTIRTLKPYDGWVRVALPVGTQPIATDSAASLGKLSLEVAASNSLWWQPAPILKSLTVSDEDTAVEATWLFDRQGAVVPVGAALARLGNYPIEIKTLVRRLDGYTEEGPTTVTGQQALTIRFPVHRIPLGRPLAAGSPSTISLAGTPGCPALAALALESLDAGRSSETVKAASKAVDDLIQGAQYTLEPHTHQRLPYASDGAGIDSLAAGALLWQAGEISTKPDSEDNSLLTSVNWRRDWYTWRIWTSDPACARRAGAFAAVAGAMCSEPARRLDAAIDQAGLAADRGLGIFLARAAGRVDGPKVLEPLWELRSTIFDKNQTPAAKCPFAETLYSQVRVFGTSSVQCSGDAAHGYVVTWTGGAPLTLASGYPLQVSGDGVQVQSVLGYTTLTASGPGPHVGNLLLPPWAKPLPPLVAPPAYDEPIN